jgi:hypothetical protein
MFWVAAILVGRSERGNKQNFILGIIIYAYSLSTIAYCSGGSRNFEKGSTILKRGHPGPPNSRKIHVFWVSNLDFY